MFEPTQSIVWNEFNIVYAPKMFEVCVEDHLLIVIRNFEKEDVRQGLLDFCVLHRVLMEAIH
jgi:ATP adenylyltransferase/5',5'''-P-1,P-4-tetraphosphate phosphorylase II